jgi:hypothetical protein
MGGPLTADEGSIDVGVDNVVQRADEGFALVGSAGQRDDRLDTLTGQVVFGGPITRKLVEFADKRLDALGCV